MGNKTITPAKTLRPQVLGDLIENTNFTESELRHWYREFRANFPEGKLSIGQFQDMCSQKFPDDDVPNFATHVLREFDGDMRDIKLDFRELMCALSVTVHGTPEQRLHWAFRMYDKDESGFISKAECEEIIKAVFKLRPHDPDTTSEDLVKQTFPQLNWNQNGTGVYEEAFVAAISGHPALFEALLPQSVKSPIERY